MKPARSWAALLATGLWGTAAHAVLLEDTYRFTPQERASYFGGVYDRASIDPKQLDCLEKVTYPRFMQALSEFVTSLPSDAQAASRKVYDKMPASLVAQLVIDKECAQ